MRAAILVASVLPSVFCLEAQITATLARLPDGRDEVTIRNNSGTSLVAFAVAAKEAPFERFAANKPVVVYSDPLIEPSAKPLPAGEDRVAISRHMVTLGRFPGGPSGRRVLEEPIVTAGIFADGVTTGDTALLNRLILRRSSMLLAVETALETLADAGRYNRPRDPLVKQFKTMADSLNRWYLSPEQQVGRSVYQSIMGKLLNLPEGRLGEPFPPSTFVAEETAALNRQRVTLSESQPSLADAALVIR